MVIGHSLGLNVANKAINDLLKYGTRPWVNPKMTSLILPEGTVTSPGRLHYGVPWAAFSESAFCIYYRGYTGIESASTQYTLAEGKSAVLKQILPMVGYGDGYRTDLDYIIGTACDCDLYQDGEIVANLGTIQFDEGLTLPNPIVFNGIRFKNFVGGGHGDLVGWNAFPLVGYQL